MKTYHSLEEMPPDLRSSVQSMQAETVSTTVKEIYKFREADGQEKTYHSLDEMPPHVRAIIESVLNESKGITLSKAERQKWEERLMMLSEKMRPLGEEIQELKLQIRLKKQKVQYLQ